MDQEAKDRILLRHNELRQKLAGGEEENQPAAGNMRKMVQINLENFKHFHSFIRYGMKS